MLNIFGDNTFHRYHHLFGDNVFILIFASIIQYLKEINRYIIVYQMVGINISKGRYFRGLDTPRIEI